LQRPKATNQKGENMIELLTAKLGSASLAYATTGVAGVGVAWILKRIPNATIKARVGAMMYGLGVTCTLGISKMKFTKKLWNKTIEPYVIDAIDNILVTGISKFVEGMKSDN
tara:strand:- start:152 stop:487 length:336 start_codon:yes stop_codon:yes gene_type:complete